MTPDATSLLSEMTALCEALAPDEGVTPSPLAGVKFGRSNVSMSRHPVLYEPGIFILCRGRKRGYLGDRVFSYGANQFLLLTVPMPFEAETIVAEDGPLTTKFGALGGAEGRKRTTMKPFKPGVFVPPTPPTTAILP